MALAAFAQSPGLQVVEASAVKEFVKGRNVPRGAIVHFRGDDPEDGPIVRYTVITRALRQAAIALEGQKSDTNSNGRPARRRSTLQY
jgi:hypothetical protein